MHIPTRATRHFALIAIAVLGPFIAIPAQAQQDRPAPPPRRQQARPPRQGPERGGPKQPYSIDQAVSDNAQLHTIAFNGLAFLTGDFGAATFMPPGKVCDFFGFQYMRDIDAAGKGHNPMFLDRIAANVHNTLDENQRKLFLDLAAEQAPQMEQLARMRLPVIQAFHMQRDGKLPAGSTGLDRTAVMHSLGDLFAMDAAMSYRRAQVFSQVALSLTDLQRKTLGAMKFGDFSSWPDAGDHGRFRPPRGNSELYGVAYMTYTSEFFSWYAGGIEADTYFCPERHGTYFGGFYMKDMPAMGKHDYDISTSRTGDGGSDFLEKILGEDQRREVTALIDAQRKDLAEVVSVRREISTALRSFLDGQTPDREKVLALGRRYGELDGDMSWMYTMAFARVNKTLTPDQRTRMMKLRNLDGYASAPYYIYSRGAKQAPALEGVGNFFSAPAGGAGK